MTDSQPGTWECSRRRVLRWAGTTALVGVAGCSGGDTTEKPTTRTTETPTETATETPTNPETITATPTPPTSQEEEWPMYLHDRTNTQHNRATTGPTNSVGVAWVFETGGKVLSSPAVVDETVYIGSSDGSLYALNMGTGEQEWTFETGGPVLSSPAVVDGTVYVGSNDQRLYAVAAESGEKRWEFETGGAVRSSPTIAEPLTSSIQRLLAIGSDDGTLYLLDAATGEKRKEISTLYGKPVVSTPALFLGRGPSVWIEFGSTSGRRYHGQAEKGMDVLAHRPFDKTAIYSSVTMPFTERPMTEIEDKSFLQIFGTDAGTLHKILELGETGWEFDTDGKIRSSPALADGVAYVGSWDHHVYAVDLYSGNQQWAFETGDKVESAPAVADGVLYVGSADQHVYALDTATGEPLWDVRTGDGVFSSPAVVNGTVFVGSTDGLVYALTTGE